MVNYRTLLTLLLLGMTASAHAAAPPLPVPFREAKIKEHFGAQVPPELTFTRSDGRQVQLREYFNKRPIVLTMVYYECPMLCTFVLNGLTDALKGTDLVPGEDFEALTVSINPLETSAMAAVKKDNYLKELGRPGAGDGWHWFTGEESSIRRLADTIGFGYYYDEQQEEYAHQAALFILTPDGKVSRYLYGIQFEPKDLRLALLEVGRDHIDSPLDRLVAGATLFFYKFYPTTVFYTLQAFRLMQAGGILTALLLGSLLGTLWVRDARRGRRERDLAAANVSPAAGPG